MRRRAGFFVLLLIGAGLSGCDRCGDWNFHWPKACAEPSWGSGGPAASLSAWASLLRAR